ncbi:hypothetical protein ADILRU_2041 [Leifsonia rubra CMS 76R]|nr:hypothetical protein ADILRU_2041 [Leifsonia rubra CMS 76R]
MTDSQQAESIHSAPQGRLRAVSTVLGSLIIPAPILASELAEAIMDSANPAGLEQLNVPLAYLSEILVTSLAVLAVVIIAFLVSLVMLAMRTKSKRALALPITVAAIQIVVGVLSLVFSQIVSSAGG